MKGKSIVSNRFHKVESKKQHSSFSVLEQYQKNVTQLFISDKNVGISR